MKLFVVVKVYYLPEQDYASQSIERIFDTEYAAQAYAHKLQIEASSKDDNHTLTIEKIEGVLDSVQAKINEVIQLISNE